MSTWPASDGLSITASIRSHALRCGVQPQMGEAGKLLGHGPAGAQRDGTRRQAIDHRLPDGAKVARALHDQHLVHAVGRVQRVAKPQPREPRTGRCRAHRRNSARRSRRDGVRRRSPRDRCRHPGRCGPGRERTGRAAAGRRAKSAPCGSIADWPGIGRMRGRRHSSARRRAAATVETDPRRGAQQGGALRRAGSGPSGRGRPGARPAPMAAAPTRSPDDPSGRTIHQAADERGAAQRQGHGRKPNRRRSGHAPIGKRHEAQPPQLLPDRADRASPACRISSRSRAPCRRPGPRRPVAASPSGATMLEMASSPRPKRAGRSRAAGASGPLATTLPRRRAWAEAGRQTTAAMGSGTTHRDSARRHQRDEDQPDGRDQVAEDTHGEVQPADGVEPRLGDQAQMLQVALAPAAVTHVKLGRVCGASSALPRSRGPAPPPSPARRIQAASMKSWLRSDAAPRAHLPERTGKALAARKAATRMIALWPQ
jgi:hypothetical protein